MIYSSGCKRADAIQKEIDLSKAYISIKIAYKYESPMIQQLRRALGLYYPNITLEIVSDGYIDVKDKNSAEEWEKWLIQYQPDIIISDYEDMYITLAKSGLLAPLDQWIESDNLDLSVFVPAVIDWLREQSSDGKLYGLATTFSNRALLYNKTHFDELGIDYPDLKMSWFEVLQLARRFHQPDHTLYGLQYLYWSRQPFGLIAEIGRTEELRLYDRVTGDVFANTSSWKKIWEEVIETYRSNAFNLDMTFLPENTAMIITDESLLDSVNSGEQNIWEAVYYPVRLENPNQTASYRVKFPISIYNQSPKQAYAWEILKFWTGELFFRYQGSTQPFLAGLPARQAYLNIPMLENGNVFYDQSVKPNMIPETGELDKIVDTGNRYFNKVLSNEIPLEEALELFQKDIKDILNEIREGEQKNS